MTITSAHLQNYRSYIDDVFEFSPDVNIIVGPNASGKTNLLDALYFIASGGSIKLSRDSIIRDEQAWARVDGLTSTNQARVIKVDPNEKSVPILIDEKNIRNCRLIWFCQLCYLSRTTFILLLPHQKCVANSLMRFLIKPTPNLTV